MSPAKPAVDLEPNTFFLMRDFSSDSDYNEFVSDILQPIQFEPVFTAAEIQTKKDLVATSAIVFQRRSENT